MIRVLEVLATLKRAGAETMVTSLVRGLDRSRFEPSVVSLYDPFPGGLEPELTGVPIHHLGKRPGFDPRIYPRLRRVLRDFQPHIVHTHSYVMRYVLPVSRSAMVHTVHNLARNEVDALGRLIHRVGYRRGVIPVAVAEQVARSFEQVYGFTPKLIPNGIDTSRFGPARGCGAPVRIVSVARLDPQKNPLLLAGAIPQGCELVMVGDGSLRHQLEQYPAVRLLGVRSDIPDILADSDIFALASDWEGHPIALMEAMAAGLPVVATAVGGIPEIVGDAGILVPPRDAAALQDALVRLASDPALRTALARKARERAAHFDVTRMVAAYEALFERAIWP